MARALKNGDRIQFNTDPVTPAVVVGVFKDGYALIIGEHAPDAEAKKLPFDVAAKAVEDGFLTLPEGTKVKAVKAKKKTKKKAKPKAAVVPPWGK